MSVAVANLTQNPGIGSSGNRRVVVKDITFDSGYVTGGEPLTAVSVGLRAIRYGIVNIKVPSADVASIVVIPQADGSALLKCNTVTAEIANAVDLSALVGTAILWGDV